MLTWFKTVNRVLRNEPETYLAYFYGRNVKDTSEHTGAGPKHSAWLFGLTKFAKYLIKNTSLKANKAKNEVKFLFVAGTFNQAQALRQLKDELNSKEVSSASYAPMHFVTKKTGFNSYQKIEYTILDSFKVLILLLFRMRPLYLQLRKSNSTLIKKDFERFCKVYIYLIYFYRLSEYHQPEFVVTANDHNALNRCLLGVAHSLGIRTVYVQHASVSASFPALRVNYAFLDGKAALNTYKKCENNTADRYNSITPRPIIFLTGQNRRTINQNKNNGIIGVAINTLDDINVVVDTCRFLIKKGFALKLRWHPRQHDKDKKRIISCFNSIDDVGFSDPENCTLEEFFQDLSVMIAADSSIHLDSALASVVPIYYRFSDRIVFDYYGYVKSGLAIYARAISRLSELCEKGVKGELSISDSTIKHYSHTYKTHWEGRENELIAQCLIMICKGEKPENIFGFEEYW